LKNILGFEDATLETVITTLISTLLPGFDINTVWIIKYFADYKKRRVKV
jgi:hypothetical protein